MKSLKEFAKKPELLEIVLDSEDIIAECGEAITFYMYDYVDINTYFDFYRSQTEGKKLDTVLQKIILDKDGNPAMDEGAVLPINLSVAVLGKVNENLGKLKTRLSTSEIGNQPN